MEMRKEFNSFDDNRELVIKKSRDILKLSKQVIYSVHRDDLKEADKLVKKIDAEKKKAEKIVDKNSKLGAIGAYKVAIGEYVEAMLFYGYVKYRQIFTKQDLEVDTDYYLLGLADLSGELVRKAILDATQGNNLSPIEARDLISEIYTWLLEFDIRNGDLRKKFDGIKYDLRKMEDLCFQLSLKK